MDCLLHAWNTAGSLLHYGMNSHIMIFCWTHHYLAWSHHCPRSCDHFHSAGLFHWQSLFPDTDSVFQDNKAPFYTSNIVQDWFMSTNMKLHICYGLSNCPISILFIPCDQCQKKKMFEYNIWVSSVKEFAKVLQEKWYKFPLNTIQNMYLCISRRLQVVLYTSNCFMLY